MQAKKKIKSGSFHRGQGANHPITPRRSRLFFVLLLFLLF